MDGLAVHRFIDLKHMDSHAHQMQTGLGNELILENIRAVARVQCYLDSETPF